MHVRVKDAEFEALRDAAAASDVPLSSVIRDRLRAAAQPPPKMLLPMGSSSHAELVAAPPTPSPRPAWHIDDLGADHLRLNNGALKR